MILSYGKVKAGVGEGKHVVRKQHQTFTNKRGKGLCLQHSLSNYIPLNPSCVDNWEVLSSDTQTSGFDAMINAEMGKALSGSSGMAAALGAKQKTTRMVAVTWVDGSQSLIQFTHKGFDLFLQGMF